MPKQLLIGQIRSHPNVMAIWHLHSIIILATNTAGNKWIKHREGDISHEQTSFPRDRRAIQEDNESEMHASVPSACAAYRRAGVQACKKRYSYPPKLAILLNQL